VIADLHAHYPMHLVPAGRVRLWRLLVSGAERTRLRDRIRALVIGLASRFVNHAGFRSGPRVRISYMQEGGVAVALSVLYSFFDEVDLLDGPRPKARYVSTLEAQLETVRRDIEANHSADAFIATEPGALATAGDGRVALVHCVEGGFHLGETPADVRAAVGRLAALGVAYVTLAHLIWRGVATDAPALPFMSDEEYRRWLPQPEEGLSELGRAAVEAMVEHGVLIDLAHMSERSLTDTFDLLDRLDSQRSVPVLVTHAGYRFGTQEYMLSEETVERIAARDGVIGLIFARHQLEDGPPPVPRKQLPRLTREGRLDGSVATLCAHIDRIGEIAGSHRHVAIGSDLDGFIKPTLGGIRDMRDMARVEELLRARYGDTTAQLICSDNALRPLRTYWRRNGGGG
jgi:microsomal dipeptidase-like Zn-dependent dipeptidase